MFPFCRSRKIILPKTCTAAIIKKKNQKTIQHKILTALKTVNLNKTSRIVTVLQEPLWNNHPLQKEKKN